MYSVRVTVYKIRVLRASCRLADWPNIAINRRHFPVCRFIFFPCTCIGFTILAFSLISVNPKDETVGLVELAAMVIQFMMQMCSLDGAGELFIGCLTRHLPWLYKGIA